MNKKETEPNKVHRWDGPNKRMSRRHKLQQCIEAKRSGLLVSNPTALTFAGAKAHFERGLVSRDVVSPDCIDTIQTCKPNGRHDTEVVLRSLIDIRDKCLPGMSIWPHDFSSFTNGYSTAVFKTPAFLWGGSKPNWYKKPTFRQEMDRFQTKIPPKYTILDIDLCGVFSERNAEDITMLMKKNALAKRGLLFINHMNGRDNPGGGLKIFDFLRTYFHDHRHFDIDSLVDRSGLRPDFSRPDELTWYYIRRVMAPIYYVCEAFDSGYKLKLNHLVEYRDKNESSHAGMVMLQWYFEFSQRDSVELEHGASVAEFAAADMEERKWLQRELIRLSREAYFYSAAKD